MVQCNTSLIPESILNCFVFIEELINEKNQSIQCLEECSDIINYCEKANLLDSLENFYRNFASKSPYYQTSILVPLGIFSNCLLLLTLFNPTLTGTTFVFLKSLAILQLVQGGFVILKQGNIYPFIISSTMENKIMIVLVRLIKMFACMVSYFLALERFLAVCCSTKTSKFDFKKFFIFSIIISFAISCLYLEYFVGMYSLRYKDSDKGYYYYLAESTANNKIHFSIIYPILIFIQITALVSVIVFSIAVFRKLQLRDRQVSQMFSSVEAIKEHKKMLLLCRFQIIDTVSMSIDMIIFIASNTAYCLTRSLEYYTLDYGGCTLDSLEFNENLSIFDHIFAYIREIYTALAHAELFFVYLIAMKKFRMAFILTMKSFYLKVKGNQ